MPAARTENAAIQADGLDRPPAASSATPTAHAPNADRLKPTVECVAIVAPRWLGFAAIAMPDVRAPESAGAVIAYAMIKGSRNNGDLSANIPISSASTAEENMTTLIARCRPILSASSLPRMLAG